jgi:2,3-bisphosphoglycerate-independent phosphoglycerate mutase
MNSPKPVVLIILDGWGIAPPGPGNAVTLAKTPNMNKYWSVYPHALLSASGESVGLPKGEKGNSETGHLNLGAGRIVFQDLPRINLSIADGSFFENSAFKISIEHVKKSQSNFHLLGLIGAGGVHSSIEHLFALLHLLKDNQVPNVYLHLFTDGRDSPPTSALVYLDQVETKMKNLSVGKIATLCGRYFAMDRDYHWDRTQKAYELLTQGIGKESPSLQAAISESYTQGKTDEFLEPTILDKNGLVSDNDSIIFFNFRIDRPRQLTKAFIMPNFEALSFERATFDPYAERYGIKQYQAPQTKTTFKRTKVLKNLCFVTMVEYEKGLPVQIAFPPETVSLPLGRILSERGLRQFHLAETEKERFVTYYFNGQREAPFAGEDRIEIPSPDVPTYDKKPEMAAYEVTEEVVKRIQINLYDFIIVNFANPDMVGHTGVLEAGIKACEVVDECLAKIVSVVNAAGGVSVITADHGNVEEMINLQTGKVDTEHSVNPVPFIIIGSPEDSSGKTLPRGVLADVTPTILGLMGIEKPAVITGRNLLG